MSMFQKVIKQAGFTTLRKTLLAAATVASLGLFAAPAQASLIGDTVNCDITPSTLWSCDPTTAVVGAEAEFDMIYLGNTTFFEVDISASSIMLSYVPTLGSLFMGANEIAIFSDLNPLGGTGVIAGIENFVASGVTGMALEDISFDDHSVSITLHNSSWNNGHFLSFDLIYRDTAQRVSEPAALALLGLGLAGIGLARRRHKVR